jgi:predicted methyltransferase
LTGIASGLQHPPCQNQPIGQLAGSEKTNVASLRASLGASFVLAASCLATSLCVAADDPITAAIASERPPTDRVEDSWRKPEEVLRFLEIAPGQHALDFFAGPGYYSELMSRVVGPTGSVLIYNDALYTQAAHHDLMVRMGRGRLPNAKMINEPANYLRLKPESLDRVLFVLVYHDLYWQPRDAAESLGKADRVLSILRAALKPGGLVVVVEHAANDTARAEVTGVANRLHRIDPKIVREDFEQAGFEFVGESDVLRHPDDDHTRSVFSPAVRKRTDQFIYKFRKK